MTHLDFTEPCDWTFPVPIYFGAGRLSETASLVRAQGLRNPLIVTDRASRGLGFVTRLQAILKAGGLRSAVFSEVSPNPHDTDIALGRIAFMQGMHDSVIAIGGGSGMDAGKAISLVAQVEQTLWDFDYDILPDDTLVAGDLAPVMCIPTTAGTGAETESTAMVTDTAAVTKRCVWHPVQKPFAVILDPELTVGLPRNLTAWTGCDALVHAIEAYCVEALHPMCDGAALQALTLISRWLPEAVDNPTSQSARGAMLVGSCLAGVSFLKGLGLVHSISHMVGAQYDSHHGLTNAILLPTVLRFNRPAIEAKLPALSFAMGLESRDFDGFLAAVERLLDHCDIARSLADLGVTTDATMRLANKAHHDAATATNPRSATVAQIAGLIELAIAHAR